MPTVVKQSARPTQVAKRPPATGSAWDLVDTIRMLCYGQSGTGKTTFAATFPGPILWLLCSGGDKPGELRSIDTPEYRRKITPKLLRTKADYEDAVADAGAYATVVLDHASGLSDLYLAEILGKPIPAQKGWGLASQQQYGQLALQLKESFRGLLNLPGNVVVIAQERTFGGSDDAVQSDVIKPTVGAALSPSVTGWLNPACDFVVQAFKRPKMTRRSRVVAGKEVVTEERAGKVEYCLRTEPHETFMTKFRVPKGTDLPDVIVDPDYDKVLAVIRGET